MSPNSTKRPMSAEPHVPMYWKPEFQKASQPKKKEQSMQAFLRIVSAREFVKKHIAQLSSFFAWRHNFPISFFSRQETRTLQGALDGGHQNIDGHGVADRSCSSIGRKSFGRLGLQHSFANLVRQPLKSRHLLRQQSSSHCWQVVACLLAPCTGQAR